MDDIKMDDFKRALAERCIATGRTPHYICRVNSAKDVLGRPTPFTEMKKGGFYRISVDVQQMENANVLKKNIHYDVDGESVSFAPPKETKMEEGILVTDILVKDGMFFVETFGHAYTTIPFPKEWSHALENERTIQTTKLIDRATDEADRWFKDDSIKLATQFGLIEPVAETRDVNGTLNLMISAIDQYLYENNPPKPYSENVIREIKSAACKAVYGRLEEINLEKDMALVRKLMSYNMPILSYEKVWYDRDSFDTLSKATKGASVSTVLPVRPIISERSTEDVQFKGLTVLDKKDIDGTTVFFTDRCILVHGKNLGHLEEAAKEVLRRDGNLTPEVENCDLMQYMSWTQKHSNQVLNVPSISFNDKHWVLRAQQRDLFIERFDEIAKNAHEHNLSIHLLPEQQMKHMAQFRLIDRGGVAHQIEPDELMPGMRVMIINGSNEFKTHNFEEVGEVVEIQELMRTASGDLTFVTDNGLYTNNSQLVEHCKNFSQQIEEQQIGGLEDVSGNEGPIIE